MTSVPIARRDVSDPAAPAKCPACNSRDLVTTSKVVDAASYWRCVTCGEVWNAERQRAAGRYRFDRPFGR